jgi:hypothetical protein
MHSKPLGCCWESNLQIVTIKISEVMWLLCHTSLGKFLPNMDKVCTVVLKQMNMFPIEFLCISWPLLSVISDRHQSTNIGDRNINIKFHLTLLMVPPPSLIDQKKPFIVLVCWRINKNYHHLYSNSSTISLLCSDYFLKYYSLVLKKFERSKLTDIRRTPSNGYILNVNIRGTNPLSASKKEVYHWISLLNGGVYFMWFFFF